MKDKIRVIDLFNKIANDELKRGTNIIYQGKKYIYDFPNLCGIYVDGNASKENLFEVLNLNCANLKYEVTIIEEIEKPEEIELLESAFCWSVDSKNDINEAFRDLSRIVFEQKDKINEIIDVVNNLKKEDDK